MTFYDLRLFFFWMINPPFIHPTMLPTLIVHAHMSPPPKYTPIATNSQFDIQNPKLCAGNTESGSFFGDLSRSLLQFCALEHIYRKMLSVAYLRDELSVPSEP